MPVTNPAADREARYRTVLSEAARSDEFSLAALKLCLREEQPSFVTRTVNALVRDGLLEPTSASPKPSYRWALDRNTDGIEAWIQRKIHASQIKNGPVADRPRDGAEAPKAGVPRDVGDGEPRRVALIRHDENGAQSQCSADTPDGAPAVEHFAASGFAGSPSIGTQRGRWVPIYGAVTCTRLWMPTRNRP